MAVLRQLFAAVGTLCAEYAGVAAAGPLGGLPAWVSATAAGTLITLVMVLRSFATLFFGVGLLGSSLLAAAIVPIATSYSIAEGVGKPASLDPDTKHFR
ncbi:hypothetical protein [Gemmatimonas sp.]|uniref:hypothetical protein n=2 Tax=Gemmatimonas sp. TaxID=1962908 RepID=UPI003565F7FA